MWIVQEGRARDLERMEHNHFDGAACQEGPENVASFVNGQHRQPSERNDRADEDKLVNSPHGLTSTADRVPCARLLRGHVVKLFAVSPKPERSAPRSILSARTRFCRDRKHMGNERRERSPSPINSFAGGP